MPYNLNIKSKNNLRAYPENLLDHYLQIFSNF